ncbi:hypothetical protein [Flavobacterium phycosphaerae]|uniref:hypothetical protein n=1 Tax=Flavobacterium phycosphaerae TaxID=2697515 RepID=UPI00138A0F26|nr:hypothetical protein [Flavobacterium phycosphaerae]
MKQLILITAMLVAMTTKLLAQDKNAIEIKNSVTQNESNQFEIVANEEVDVNLKFNLKLDDKIKVLVTNQQNEVVYAKVYHKQGENRLAFTMAENEKYTVLLNGSEHSNLKVHFSEN